MNELHKQAHRTTGPIPVRGKLNGKRFHQTVVKYQGAWRLYLNTQMRMDAALDVGDIVKVQVEFDPEPRIVPMHPKLGRALTKSKQAQLAFERLSPSHQREILRYLHSLKTEVSVARIVQKVIRQLLETKTKSFLARR
ncbi:MAG: YdeI/OmpD-associated family protein [Bacteroidetes bacterium]|nr:YdeI/OmpD-associated family protein [Bacteroidota bacterium]